ncbi:hypothetical protein GOP47_0021142 [Adiantum capillus-veneris]|uniref:Uncharacterized protein n=1 Tax=Adiantum capillus-veneris TaxID=13818 RepID=A0A9D4UAY7_ADICA|nr:hypothetical protein GOP47_0021142 [Adiantum capillus-veneris]
MQNRSSTDMESFTGLVPAIYSFFQNKIKLQSYDQFYGIDSDVRQLHADVEGGADINLGHVMQQEATNPPSDWRLVRQSSIDHLISHNLNASHNYSRPSPFSNPCIPYHVYAKLKKKMRYTFFSSSSSKLQRHHCNKLNDIARFGGS